jgi:spermidine/putrescine-binding protein
MTKVRALLGGLAMLVLLAFVAGCGLVSDQARQEAKKKVEAKGQQVRQDLKKKVEAGQGGLKKKVDDAQPKLDAVQTMVNELLKKVDAQEQQNQKK